MSERKELPELPDSFKDERCAKCFRPQATTEAWRGYTPTLYGERAFQQLCWGNRFNCDDRRDQRIAELESEVARLQQFKRLDALAREVMDFAANASPAPVTAPGGVDVVGLLRRLRRDLHVTPDGSCLVIMDAPRLMCTVCEIDDALAKLSQ